MRLFMSLAVGATFLAGGATALLLGNQAAVASSAERPAIPPAEDCQDEDGDGYGLGCRTGRDCNDWDATIHPGQREVCNFRDDDCNALVDDNARCVDPPLDPSPVLVPDGAFLMGSAHAAKDERPQHIVDLAAVRIDRYEVTNQRYAECVAAGACTRPTLLSSRHRKSYFENPRFSDYPVIFVSWHQADAFCRHAGGRLPTEAQWEKAARGSEIEERSFPWGNEPPTCPLANMGGAGSCVGDTDRVGRRLLGQSPYGAHDMAGNVWEWVADWYDADYYSKSPGKNPTGPATGRLKIMRGGCWVSGADSLRVSCRKAQLPSAWAYNVGFRCAYPEGR